MAMIFDSTAPADIPNADHGYVFAYNDGRYSQVGAVQARFPDARVITISAIGEASADVVDVEEGCVWPPSSAVAYVQRERAAGRNPAVYCGRSNWPAVVQAFYDAGMAQPSYWIAHYTNSPHLCSSSCYPSSVGSLVAVATQYGGDLPGHYDVTVTNGTWPDGITAEGAGTPLTTPASIGGALSEEDDMPYTEAELRKFINEEVGKALVASGTAGAGDWSIGQYESGDYTVGAKASKIVSDETNKVLRSEGITGGIAALLARPASSGGAVMDPAAQAKLIADLLDDELAKAVADLLAKRLAA